MNYLFIITNMYKEYWKKIDAGYLTVSNLIEQSKNWIYENELQ